MMWWPSGMFDVIKIYYNVIWHGNMCHVYCDEIIYSASECEK